MGQSILYVPLRTDAEYVILAQSCEGVDDTNGEGSWQCWRHGDRYDVKRSQNCFLHLASQEEGEKVEQRYYFVKILGQGKQKYCIHVIT